MKVSLILLVAILSIAYGAPKVSKSPKKGLVWPHWPKVRVGDFDAFSTVSWWYNYHTIRDVTDIEYEVPCKEDSYKCKLGKEIKGKSWWCTDSNGDRPHFNDGCFPSDPSIEFVPLEYHSGPECLGRRPANYPQPPLAENMTMVLGINEPNMHDQGLCPARLAAKYFKDLNDRYPDKIMISPATAFVDTEWFDEFWDECQKLECRIDYLATHQYGGSPLQRIEELQKYSERYDNKKIWLTEFAQKHKPPQPGSSDEKVLIKFVKEFLPLLEHSDFIARYSWFIPRYEENHRCKNEVDNWFCLDSNNSLLDVDAPGKRGQPILTKVGKWYDHPWHLDQYNPYK